MWISLKRNLYIIICCGILTIGITGCSIFTQHEISHEEWLIQQVEQGYLTPEQAEQLRRVK